MAKFGGPVIIAQYKSTSEYVNVDRNTGQQRVDKSFRVHVPYPDGSNIPESIYFPRGDYHPPQLKVDAFYAFPVTARPSKDGKKISWTARSDVMPFDAPGQA